MAETKGAYDAMGDYRNTEVPSVGDCPALDALGHAVCQAGGHIPPRDRSREACDFHRRMAAGYLRVLAATEAVDLAPATVLNIQTPKKRGKAND